MELSFDCECGDTISEFTRGGPGSQLSTKVGCRSCDRIYAVTLTRLRGPSETHRLEAEEVSEADL